MTDEITLDAPETRLERFLAAAAGVEGITLDEPETRIERYLYKIAQGGGGSGGGVLVVHDMNGTLDKTWQEIHDSAPFVWQTDGDGGYRILVAVFEEDGDFIVTFAEPQPDGNIMRSYVATSASGYPVRQ